MKTHPKLKWSTLSGYFTIYYFLGVAFCMYCCSLGQLPLHVKERKGDGKLSTEKTKLSDKISKCKWISVIPNVWKLPMLCQELQVNLPPTNDRPTFCHTSAGEAGGWRRKMRRMKEDKNNEKTEGEWQEGE